MTCAVAYRFPGQYTLLAVDGRITDESGVIHTERAQKFCQAGRFVAAFAGDLAVFQGVIRSWVANASVIDSVDAAMRLVPKNDGAVGKDWEAIVYDVFDDALYTVDSTGARLRHHEKVLAIGSGADVALGYLKARLRSATPAKRATAAKWPLGVGKRNMRGAIRAASERHASCGAAATLITCVGGRVSVRG